MQVDAMVTDIEQFRCAAGTAEGVTPGDYASVVQAVTEEGAGA